LQASSTATKTTTNTTMTTSGPALPKARFNWIFPADKFMSTPSMLDRVSADEELDLRQNAAVFIYELGNNLKVYVAFILRLDVFIDLCIVSVSQTTLLR
jgi:hypothetical protein